MISPPDVKVSNNGYRSVVSGSRDLLPVAIERILVPTDLGVESERTIEYGFVLARRFGAHLTLLHVLKEPCTVEQMKGADACDAVVEERMRSKNMLKSIAEEVRKHYPDCDTEFRDGKRWEQIVYMAKEQNIDLIVISTHHYNWLKRLVYGCDAGQILSQARCPILVLHDKSSLGCRDPGARLAR
jgi:nucleotide-binding universal stress UspA family protein